MTPLLSKIQNVNIFGLDITFDSVAFTIPGINWDVYWYGIVIALGFLCALIYGFKNAKRFNLNSDRMSDVILVTTPVAILCARLYFVLFYRYDKIESIGDFFGFSSGSGIAGLAIYGGVIGAFLCGWLMCKLRKVKFADMLDVAAIGFLIGQAFGRWGNFFNQEAYGSFTGSTWWGMTSDTIAAEMQSGELVHPCFLYESIWCAIGVFVLHYISKKRKFSGQVALSYGIWYGAGRAVIEGLRTDSLYLYGNVRVSQLLSVMIVVACAITLYVLYTKAKSNEGDYTPMFSEETMAIDELSQTAETENPAEEITDEPTQDISEEQECQQE